MSSRFFKASDSSDSDSDEQELYSDGEEEAPRQPAEADSEEDSEDADEDSSSSGSDDDEPGVVGAARFFKDASSSDSDSDDEQVTEVKSAKDKRFDEANVVIKSLEQFVRIDDWANINSEFDKLGRLIPNLVKLLDGKNPKFYIKALSELESTSSEAYEKQKTSAKKWAADKQRGLNAVRQKVRRIIKEPGYAQDIEKYNADPTEFMKEVQVVAESASSKPKAKRVQVEGVAADVDDLEGWGTVGRDGKILAFTPESILKNLRQIGESRGRKGTDRVEQVRVLEKLYEVAQTDYQKIRVLLALLAARFDTTSQTGTALEVAQWKAAQKELQKLFETLEATSDIVVIDGAEDWEDDEKQPVIPAEKVFKVPGSPTAFAERLDDELTRSLQNIDPHTPEYIERLQDEALLYGTVVRAQLYQEYLLEKHAITGEQSGLNRVISRRIEHLYFKPSKVVETLEAQTWKNVPESLVSNITPKSFEADPNLLVRTLCNYIFKEGDGTQRARAMLAQIYWLALHDKYFESRDYMLMSHLSESISGFDTPTQVLFNRALVQTGMAAFRKGLISDAQHTLQEICGSNRQKELLAQGVQMQRYSQISPDQERLEKQRLYPFHMHINLELLETIYLTSSMLLEIPLLAQLGSAPESKRRIISKQFRRLLEYHERAIFTGPPENTRDHVLQAAKALAAGNWRKSADLISAIKIWDLLPAAETIKAMLTAQIQAEGLRTYLFTYAPFYDTLNLTTLAEMFDLPAVKVSAVISRMIAHEEIAAAMDQVSSSIIFRKGVDLSRLQSLSLAMGDKAMVLLENNEKTLETRTQGMAGAFERQGGRGRGQRGGRGGRGGGQGAPRVPRGQGFVGGALGRSIPT